MKLLQQKIIKKYLHKVLKSVLQSVHFGKGINA